MKEFDKWLGKEFPKLALSFQMLPISEIIDLRNAGAHQSLSLDKGRKASQICRQILDKVFEK